MQLTVQLRAAERVVELQRDRGGGSSDVRTGSDVHAKSGETSEREQDFGRALSAAEERVASMVVDVLGAVEGKDDPFSRVVVALGDELKALRVATARQAEDARKMADEAAKVAEAQRAELYAELAAARSQAEAEARALQEALQEARDAHHAEMQGQKYSGAEAILRAEQEVERKMAQKVDRLLAEMSQVNVELIFKIR